MQQFYRKRSAQFLPKRIKKILFVAQAAQTIYLWQRSARLVNTPLPCNFLAAAYTMVYLCCQSLSRNLKLLKMKIAANLKPALYTLLQTLRRFINNHQPTWHNLKLLPIISQNNKITLPTNSLVTKLTHLNMKPCNRQLYQFGTALC